MQNDNITSLFMILKYINNKKTAEKICGLNIVIHFVPHFYLCGTFVSAAFWSPLLAGLAATGASAFTADSLATADLATTAFSVLAGAFLTA